MSTFPTGSGPRRAVDVTIPPPPQSTSGVATHPLVLGVPPVVLLATGVALSAVQRISGPVFLGVLALATLTFLALYFGPRLKSVDLRALKMELAKVEGARQDVVEKAGEVRTLARRLAELIAFTQAWSNRVGDDTGNALRRQWLDAKLQQLAEAIALEGKQVQDITRYTRGLAQLDGEKDPQRRAEQVARLYDMLRSDIEAEGPRRSGSGGR